MVVVVLWSKSRQFLVAHDPARLVLPRQPLPRANTHARTTALMPLSKGGLFGQCRASPASLCELGRQFAHGATLTLRTPSSRVSSAIQFCVSGRSGIVRGTSPQQDSSPHLGRTFAEGARVGDSAEDEPQLQKRRQLPKLSNSTSIHCVANPLRAGTSIVAFSTGTFGIHCFRGFSHQQVARFAC